LQLKKTLSANPEAPLNIECLMDDKDVRGTMNREKFEELAQPVLKRVLAPLQQVSRFRV
jgi:molecular chaperone DnaK (HSP70)